MRTPRSTLALAAILVAAPVRAQDTGVAAPQEGGRECHSMQIATAAGPVTVRWGQRAEFGGCRLTVSDFDTDRNGRVSADETPPSGSKGSAFSSLDRDRDGYIDDPELQAGERQ